MALTIADIQAKDEVILSTVVAVSDGVDKLNAQIATLQAALDAAGNIPADVQAAIDKLGATTDSIQTSLDAVKTKEPA